jgi:hypothetical protein
MFDIPLIKSIWPAEPPRNAEFLRFRCGLLRPVVIQGVAQWQPMPGRSHVLLTSETETLPRHLERCSRAGIFVANIEVQPGDPVEDEDLRRFFLHRLITSSGKAIPSHSRTRFHTTILSELEEVIPWQTRTPWTLRNG